MDRESVSTVLATPLAQELLRSSPLVHLAYIGRDGYPRVIPTGYVWKGGKFVVCTADNAPKVRSLGSNPKVALTIDTQTLPPRILLVRGTASMEIVDGVPDDYLEASHKGVPRKEWDGFDAQVRGLYPRMARISITPEWAKLIDFETTLPQAVEELLAQRK
ncbi:MAG: pyridoxamine 5-phosphate oxidase [Chloroflexi bacterium]|nr:MAG: pyridoxamine 5-phosphate oxidase [Chloroflexota bacterium]